MSEPIANENVSAQAGQDASAEPAPAIGQVSPVAPLFDPATTYSYIPYRMLTREVLDACLVTPQPVDNKKRNAKAQGNSSWIKFNVSKFKKLYPEFKCRLNDDKLCFRTPYMHSPFAISAFDDKPDDKTISLSYGKTRDDDVEAFAEWAEKVFDDWFITRIAGKSKMFLGKDNEPADQVAKLYVGLYRWTEEDQEKGQAPKTGGFKILRGKDAGRLRAFHGEQEIPVDEEHILKGDFLSMDVEISTIWINKPRCGISGAIARIDRRTEAEMNNPGFAVNPDEPAAAEEAALQEE